MSLTPQQHAKYRSASLLAHYFNTAFLAAGLKWDSDNASEMEELVDEIIAAATPSTAPAADGE